MILSMRLVFLDNDDIASFNIWDDKAFGYEQRDLRVPRPPNSHAPRQHKPHECDTLRACVCLPFILIPDVPADAVLLIKRVFYISDHTGAVLSLPSPQEPHGLTLREGSRDPLTETA